MSTLPKGRAASYGRAQWPVASNLDDQHMRNEHVAAGDGFEIRPHNRFEDIGSGAEPNRPGLEALIRAAEEESSFQRLYVSDYARLCRSANLEDHWALWSRFDAAGVEIIATRHRREVAS